MRLEVILRFYTLLAFFSHGVEHFKVVNFFIILQHHI